MRRRTNRQEINHHQFAVVFPSGVQKSRFRCPAHGQGRGAIEHPRPVDPLVDFRRQIGLLHLSGFLACVIPEELQSLTLNFVQELGVRSFVRRAFWLQESSPRLLPTTSHRYERSGQLTDSANLYDFSSGKGALANHLRILAYFVIWSVASEPLLESGLAHSVMRAGSAANLF